MTTDSKERGTNGSNRLRLFVVTTCVFLPQGTCKLGDGCTNPDGTKVSLVDPFGHFLSFDSAYELTDDNKVSASYSTVMTEKLVSFLVTLVSYIDINLFFRVVRVQSLLLI